MLHKLEELIFRFRISIIVLFVSVTLLMSVSLVKVSIQADFSKLLPLNHEYIQTFLQYRNEFSGANRVLVAVMANDGDIFDANYFRVLEEVTNEVFFVPGIDRARVYSLFTPNVRFTEVVEDGIAGGNVIPDDFNFSNNDLQIVRENILKSNIQGRLVANDFSGAIVSAEIMSFDQGEMQKPDYSLISKELELKVRQKFESEEISIHIIGYTMIVGEVMKAGKAVFFFFLLTTLIIFLLLVVFAQSIKLAFIPLISALMAVIWQTGLLPILGISVDPMQLLVPFLVFAIAVSHSVQLINNYRDEYFNTNDSKTASRLALRRIAKPGMVALFSDAIGFLAILMIDVDIIQNTAIMACLGVIIILFINLIFLPLLLSFIKLEKINKTKNDNRQGLCFRIGRHS